MGIDIKSSLVFELRLPDSLPTETIDIVKGVLDSLDIQYVPMTKFSPHIMELTLDPLAAHENAVTHLGILTLEELGATLQDLFIPYYIEGRITTVIALPRNSPFFMMVYAILPNQKQYTQYLFTSGTADLFYLSDALYKAAREEFYGIRGAVRGLFDDRKMSFQQYKAANIIKSKALLGEESDTVYELSIDNL
ncbi:Uncharacterised protein [Oligella urethralis]|uniref:hypothetical protein n=1 Tax=Oligella urethralis TaxID=90245 RepID=UPI000E087961|nr:hypothetical protein [Oligella urethralis]SUA63383.1 Uncharacterised protein [Oligella urethralis]